MIHTLRVSNTLISGYHHDLRILTPKQTYEKDSDGPATPIKKEITLQHHSVALSSCLIFIHENNRL